MNNTNNNSQNNDKDTRSKSNQPTNTNTTKDVQADNTTPIDTSNTNIVNDAASPGISPHQVTGTTVKTPTETPQLDTPIVSDVPTDMLETKPPSDPNNFDRGSRSFGTKKTIATILGLLLLVSGVGVGVFLTGQRTKVKTSAWNCTAYIFEVSQDGVVSVRNGSTRNESTQQAIISINGSVVLTLEVPALDAGQAQTLGNVTVPDGVFTWSVEGSKDCSNEGSYAETTPPIVSAQCNEVQIYDTEWNLLSTSDLTQLNSGDDIHLTVGGTSINGTFDKAQFTVNGTLRAEVSQQRPGTEDFYDIYTIPASVDTFTINAQIHHSEFGWF